MGHLLYVWMKIKGTLRTAKQVKDSQSKPVGQENQ